jgi:hypothetical protein
VRDSDPHEAEEGDRTVERLRCRCRCRVVAEIHTKRPEEDILLAQADLDSLHRIFLEAGSTLSALVYASHATVLYRVSYRVCSSVGLLSCLRLPSI